ncbi:AT-rich interactive domain-containing protein 2-like [Diospyros lotus]|uniref:AT-rich interactive domain-containing protein 2-like n=1 Tax=Diospyros lotus TaxID=55363 RepID=UPI002259AE0E|nr:AT-rich interactive domain-containing protein 2-like [Diospyros lotus]XP_052210758.1 AT-rich interactive domain-containing protein 2-like [Diospyros lotus]
MDLDSSAKGGHGGDCKERLRSLFDQVLMVFLRDVYGGKCIRPIPALLGDGQPVDLFKLFWVVWKRGGHDFVSRNGFWDSVAEECGLDAGLMAPIKLIHMKYLNWLEQWLQWAFKDNNGFESGQSEIDGTLGSLLFMLQKEFRDVLYDEQDVKKKDGELVGLEWQKHGKYNDVNIDNRVMLLLSTRDTNEAHFDAEKMATDDDGKLSVSCENEVNVPQVVVASESSTSEKRKREPPPVFGWLRWVKEVANHPDDPALGRIPECSKWSSSSKEEVWVQALLAREALLKRHDDSSVQEPLSKKRLKMHPMMYEDRNVINHQHAERLRCSERLPSLAKHRSCPCCNTCSTSENKVATAHKEEVESSLEQVSVKRTNDQSLRNHVSVGCLFQAEVPEWTGVVSESDPKWLGTRMWSPENGKHNSLNALTSVGQGRQASCSCQFPGSVKCVRIHITERRMELKLELGGLFNQWGFDSMGEEVSLSWTLQEEERFRDMIRTTPPSLDKSFWNRVLKFFPTKSREKLLSYYFNVFIIQRRAYQNRVTPAEIDSDDDERESGCVGGSYGSNALVIPGPEVLTCAENKQCTDL